MSSVPTLPVQTAEIKTHKYDIKVRNKKAGAVVRAL